MNDRARRIEVYAHRGARALAPENTIPGYATALRLGVDWVDLDVVLTKDGEILVSHDPVLNPDIVRGPDGKFLEKSQEFVRALPLQKIGAYIQRYAVKNLTLSELQAFDVGRLNPESRYAKLFPEQVPVDGTRMPTLQEVVRYVDEASKGRVKYQIEVKNAPDHPAFGVSGSVFADALSPILEGENLYERAEIQAFDFTVLRRLKEIDSRVRTAFLTSRENERGGESDFFHEDPRIAGAWTGGVLAKDNAKTLPGFIHALGGYAWEPEDVQVTPGSVAEAHALGLKVVAWSWPERTGKTFDPEMIHRLIDAGVDGIITDDPGRLNGLLSELGYETPRKVSI